jgi:hypothetical protein
MRPTKYKTEEERVAAKRAATRLRNQRYWQRRRERSSVVPGCPPQPAQPSDPADFEEPTGQDTAAEAASRAAAGRRPTEPSDPSDFDD